MTRYRGGPIPDPVVSVVMAVYNERATGAKVPTREGPRRTGDPPVLVASPLLARERMTWEPRQPGLDAIVESALRWRREHPHGYDGQ